VVAGVSYNLRPALTLEEIFGTTSSVLTKGFASGSSDIVWVPNGNGGYSRYYLHASNVWRNVDTSLASPNVPITYTDALLIEKRGSGATLTLSGEVKVAGSTFPVVTGMNVVSTIYPAGVTLQNFGLEDDVQLGFGSGSADIIWIPNGSGGYERYYRHASNVWRNVSTNTDVTSNVTLSPGILIERRGAARTFTVTPPTSYSTL